MKKEHIEPRTEIENDPHYWHRAALHFEADPETGKIDRYRWALHYEQMARKRHGSGVNLNAVLADLAAGWEKFGGPAGLTLKEAMEVVTSSWHRSDELIADTIANHKGFKKPPTFSEKGNLVPRNVDEANT